MPDVLFRFGFETPVQHRNNEAHGWDDEDSQASLETEPQVNVSGVAWTRGSSAIIVVAEVPCSSRWKAIKRGIAAKRGNDSKAT